MLSAILGDDQHLAPLKRLIIETTSATPFFMEETIQALIDEGALQQTDGGLKLVRPLAALRIPATVQAILAARIGIVCKTMRKISYRLSRCLDANSDQLGARRSGKI